MPRSDMVLPAIRGGDPRSQPPPPGSANPPPKEPKSYTLHAEPGRYEITGSPAGLRADRVLHAEPGSYKISGDPYGPFPLQDPATAEASVVLDPVTLKSTTIVEAVGITRSPERTRVLRIEQDCDQLLLMATSLGRMARDEIVRLDGERPNDETTIERNNKQRELLLTFAEGFEQLAVALAAFAENRNEPLLLGRAREIVDCSETELAPGGKKMELKPLIGA